MLSCIDSKSDWVSSKSHTLWKAGVTTCLLSYYKWFFYLLFFSIMDEVIMWDKDRASDINKAIHLARKLCNMVYFNKNSFTLYCRYWEETKSFDLYNMQDFHNLIDYIRHYYFHNSYWIVAGKYMRDKYKLTNFYELWLHK